MKCNKAMLSFSLTLIGLASYAQEIRLDSIDKNILIEEVIITGDTKELYQKQSKSCQEHFHKFMYK